MKTGRVFQLFPIILFALLLNACAKNTSTPTSGGGTTNPPGDTTVQTGVITDITYGSAIDWKGATEQLKLDLYIPTAARAAKKPLLVWVHGGGFLVGDKDASKSFASLMAAKGFIVAPINYRLGWTKNESNPCNADTAQAFEAYYRALQDTRAAIRFLVANASKYGIDTSWIFIGGASAGGLTSLAIPYYTPDNAEATFGSEAISTLGPLDADNNIKATFKIKGVLAMWGALPTPDIITKANATPTIFFHGTDDNVVPFNVGHFYTCDNFQMGYGTKPVYDKLTSLGVPAVAHVEIGGGHGVYTDEFRADNSACFLESLMDGTPESGYYTGEQSSCQ